MATETTTKNKGKYWLFFFISLVAVTLLLMFSPEVFWFALPPGFTSFALAMDWI